MMNDESGIQERVLKDGPGTCIKCQQVKIHFICFRIHCLIFGALLVAGHDRWLIISRNEKNQT